MLFNSLPFFIFLPVVFSVYWMLNRNLKLQNWFIVFASCVSCGWWDGRAVIVMLAVGFWTYFSALGIECARAKGGTGRGIVAWTLVANLGLLGYFKYFNFFMESAVVALNAIGFEAHYETLKILLPIGISFYTFQLLGYVIDVYRGSFRATRDLAAYFAFMSFFPRLLAGPIDRASNLLTQFQSPRKFDYALAVEGCRQMLWGFFKKLVVADSCAFAANALLGSETTSCISLWVAMILYTIQIYGDFSGYSDIAIGCSKLFGLRLVRNFNYPYFARDIAEFWRRWHISLTTWFRDYLYIPLGGSRCGILKKIRNTFAIFLVSGLWHGANWTFVLWGAFHAACFLPLLLLKRNRKYTTSIVAEGHLLPNIRELCGMASTFFLAVVGWTLFRAPSITTAWAWFKKMFSFNDFSTAGTHLGHVYGSTIVAVVLLIIIEWFNRSREIPALPKAKWLRIVVYYLVIFAIFYWNSAPQSFIYFQF